MSTAEYACKACGADTALTGYDGYCAACNTPTRMVVVVAFDSGNYDQPAVFTQALTAANAFFTEYGISADHIKFPPAVTHVGYLFDRFNTEVYTLTYHLEVPAWLAGKIEARRG